MSLVKEAQQLTLPGMSESTGRVVKPGDPFGIRSATAQRRAAQRRMLLESSAKAKSHFRPNLGVKPSKGQRLRAALAKFKGNQ